MAAPRKYPLELMERGVRMVFEVREETGESRGAVTRVAKQLGVHPEALRHYVLLVLRNLAAHGSAREITAE